LKLEINERLYTIKITINNVQQITAKPNNTKNNIMIQQNPWLIAEEKFEIENLVEAESVFSTGNGYVTQRGCFEEFYSGKTSKGTFVKGVCTPSTNSNLPDWTAIVFRLNAEVVDLCTCEILSYQRVLNMKDGLLTRVFRIITPSKKTIEVEISRFLSLANTQLGAIKFKAKSIDFRGSFNFDAVIDGSINEKMYPQAEPQWNVLQSRTQADVAHLWIQTRKTNFQVCEAVSFEFFKNNSIKKLNATKIEKSNVAGYSFGADVVEGDSVSVVKYVAFSDSNRLNYRELTTNATQTCLEAKSKGWDLLLDENKQAWNTKWNKLEINISDNFEKQHDFIKEQFQNLHF
jgi:maltose phosphorylase